MIATGQITISVINDGVGITSSIIDYAVHSSGLEPPGNIMTDGSGNPILSNDGKPLTDGSWSTTIPTVQDGWYLWTRTRFILSDGSFDMIYNVSYSGEDGEAGEQGISVIRSFPQWRLSDSSTSMTGSGEGYAWQDTKPTVEAGQYIWERYQTELSNGTYISTNAYCDTTMSGVLLDVNRNKKAIAQKVWATDINTSIDQYDGSTGQAIRDRVSQTETKISGITSTVSDMQSTLSTKADGSTVTELQSVVSQNKQTADAFQQTVTSSYAKLTDVDDKIDNIKVGGNNLYIIADETPGYINGSNGSISSPSSTYKEFTSDYIPVKAGENYVIQSWCTPNTTGESWLAYQYYSNDTGTPLGSRVAKYGKDSGSGVETTAEGKEHLTYKITVPENADYIRISYRQFADGYAMIEKATTPSEYAINPKDLQSYTDDQVETVRTFAEQTADKFTWLVESGDSSSNFTLTDRTAQLVAEYINLNGTVTFSAFDADTQNALTSGAELIVGTQTSSTSAWTGTSSKLKTLGSGTRISYKLPKASTTTAVTLNLTLNDGTTTGAKNVYYLNDTRLTTQYGVNSIIELIYDGSAWRVINPYSDQNTYDRTRYQQAIKAGSTAIVAGNIIVAGANNVGTYTHLKLGNAFDTTYPILYAGSAIAANSTGTNNYLVVPMGLTTTQSGTYTAYKSVYIKGTLSGTTFTPVSTTPLTQTIPTSADNYHYMLLGTMYSTTEMYLLGEHPIFQYYNGGFKTTTQIAAEAAATATSANATANTASQNASDALSAVNASIKSTTMHYLATTAASGVTRSTSGWTTTIQSITASKRYLWTYQTITKVDNTTTDTDPVISGVWGNTGTSVTVSSNVTTYQAGTSGTTAPTGTWESTVPTVADGQFLWTKVVTTFSDNSTATSYSVAKQGIQGTSVTVSSTSTTYQSGTSGTSAPTGTWETTIPTVAQGNYLWTKTVVTYSDGKSTTSYAVSYQSEDGDTGVSVTKVEQLYRSSNSTTAPAAPTSVITSTSTANSTWTLAMPTYDATYKYYYTCTQTTYSDGSHTWTTVARSKAIEDANTTANTANSNASAAVQTANTANTNASAAVETANSANDTANAANEKAKVGLGMKVNYENFSTANAGECYLHGYTNGVAADVDGYVYWNDVKRTVPKKMINPNVTVPYWSTIYIVYRLSSASATTGTLYMVWYNSGWKYAVTPTPSAVGGTWTWAETTDIVLGQFIEPSNEGQIVDAYLYDPPRNASHIQSTGSNSYQYAKNSVDWVSTNGANVLTAKNIINNWATDATKTNTTIKGGLIQTHTILSEALATNAIMSSNYSSGVADSDTPSGAFSQAGSFLDLATGNFYTPNFGVSAQSGSYGAFINGDVVATTGKIGSNTTNYWEIGNVYDYNQSESAAIIGHGTSYIQSGNWQLSNNKLNTQYYSSTSASSGNLKYYKDSGTNTFYDVGVKIPTNFATHSASDNDDTKFAKTFFYGRKYTGNNAPSLASDWTYFFMVFNDGTLYTGGDIYESGTKLSEKYASIDGVSGAYLPLTGGTVTGNLTVNGTLTGTLSGNASTATKWASAQKVYVTLGTASTTTTIQGGSTSAQTIGVNGTLGVGNGGTGKASWTQWGIVYASTTSALSQVAAGTSGQVLTSGGSAAPGWTNQSALSVGSATKATQDANGDVIANTYRKLTNNTFDTITVTDISAGDLVVTGAASFTNGLSGDLTGNVTGNATTATTATTATKVQGNLKIQLNSGTTEGTNQFTYNGEAGKTVNITKGGIGLGNVENTALSTWAGSANLTTTKVGTLAAAATKGVDTSISSGSSSANLPTTAAVASFVEGKGYVTSSGVTSVRVQATSPVVSSTNTAQTSTLNTTIGLADAYGDTKNPYGTKTPNYVLAGPSSGTTNAAPSFRALVAADIPSLTKSKISDFPTTWALSSVSGADDLKAIEALTGTSGFLKKTAANTWTLDTNTYVTSSGVTSITLSAGEGISLNATGAITTTGTRTITNSGVRAVTESTTNGSISVNTNGTTVDVAVHGLGDLAYKDSLAKGDVGLGSVTNNRQVKGLPSNTTEGHFVLWGTDGYTVTDGGIGKGDVVAGVQISGSKLTITKADGTSTQSDVTIIASQASGATILTNANNQGLNVGDASHPTYFASGVPVQGNVIPTITLNGTANTSPSFFAPTAKGSSGQVLKSNGNNTVSWMNQSDLSVGSATSATTATKFSSSRTVALTGDVTGSASGDGSSGWSIATTVGDNSHNHDSTTIIPIATKTYTGWLGTADNNAANDSFYFMKMRPIDWNAQWMLRYRITATVAANSNYHATSDVTYYGYGQATAPAIKIFNTHYSTSYRPYYYHNFYRLTSAGYNANLSNAIGLGLRGSNGRNTSGYERTVIVEVLETVNCTVELLDSGIKWGSWASNTSTNYAGLTEYDGYTNGLRENGDDNDVTTQRAYYAHLTAGANGIKQYSLIMKDNTGKWQSFTTDSGTGTSKTKNTTGFVLGNIYYMNRSTNIAADAVTGNNEVSQYVNTINFQYSSNCGTTLTANQPVFIKGTMSGGLFYLDTTWWTQTLPTSNDGFVYIPVGTAYDTYQIAFMTGMQPIYHNGTSIVPYFEAAVAPKYAPLAGATFTGAINTANNTWNKIGDDARLGDINKAGHIGIQGVNGDTGLFFTTYNQSTKTTGGAITWDGNKFSITGTVDTSISGNAATATKATQDGNGDTIASTYLKLSGGTLTSADGVVYTVTNTTKIPAKTLSILQSPIPKYLWHDIFAFNYKCTPTYYVSTDNTTWTEATLDKRPFSQKEDFSLPIITTTQTGSRWVWQNASFSYSGGVWLVIGFAYTGSTATATITFESSTDGETWTTRHSSTHASSAAPAWFYIDNFGNASYLRLTITKDSSDTTKLCNINAIKLLTLRWGNQGGGSEYEYPYTWDADKNITAKGTFTGTFNGNATSATNAEFLTHKTVNNTSLHNTAGTFAFSGSGDPWSGTDWVGLQVGDNVDKFQITANGNAMLFRQNDSGGTNASWSNWVTMLSSANYNSYAPSLTGTGASGNWNINAATATKATQDGDGATISSTYAKLSGAAFTGAVTGTSFAASGYLACNTGNASTAGGLALYGTTPTNYGIAMRGQGNGGVHGYATGDWHTYFYMAGAATRGWIFKNTTNGNCASINGDGNAVLNGSVTIGGNTTNTSGCRLEYSETTQSLNFVFN